nr:zinc finger protein 235-like [Nerophis lumbriciformis]
MLRELIRKRLIAAADEIFELFERTIASYEEELSRTREEKARHRQELEDMYKTHIVIQSEEDQQPAHIKEEAKDLWTNEEGEGLLEAEEEDIGKLPLTVVSVKAEDDEDEPQAADLFSPLADSDETSHSHREDDGDDGRESLSSDTDCEGDLRAHTGMELSDCPEKKSDVQLLIGRQEVRPPPPPRDSAALEREEPRVKEEEEEEDVWTTQGGQGLLGLTEVPLTGVSLKSGGEESPESSQFHHRPCGEDRGAESPRRQTTEGDGDQRGGPPADKILGSDDAETPPTLGHRKTSHTAKNGFTCSVCGESFSCQSRLKKHTRAHAGAATWTCSLCAETFSLQTRMRAHMRTHEKPFACSVCGRKFARKSILKRHTLTHTGEKPFACPLCGRGFSQKSCVVSHVRTHTGEKPFACSVCGKRFALKACMAVHVRTHTGEKPFGCSVCGEHFSCKSNMNVHMRRHTGEKPFRCPVCGKCFSSKAFLRTHVQRHQGE